MEIHFGEPKHPFALRFLSGTIWQKNPPKGQRVYYSRNIKSWLGFSWRGKWFVGFVRTGEQNREDVTLSKNELAALTDGEQVEVGK